MSAYLRQISYIHLYNEAQAGKNIGFIKVQARDGSLKLSVRMKGIYTDRHESCKIYAVIKKSGGLTGVLLDETKEAASLADYQHTFTLGMNFLREGTGEELTGILFYLETQRAAAALWGDLELSKADLLSLVLADKEPPAPKAAEKKSALDGGEPGKETAVPAEAAVKRRSEQPLPAPEPAAAAVPVSVSAPAPEQRREVPEKEAVLAAEVEAAPAAADDSWQEIRDQESGEPLTKWEQIKCRYPIVHPFDRQGDMEYIHITPKDLQLLRREYWVLGNNSFLLHSFYNYRYMILGKKAGADVYMLGVPGIYHEREEMMANMFQFEHFVTSKNQPKIQGSFGYYMKQVEL